jgi:hypothetical protein
MRRRSVSRSAQSFNRAYADIVIGGAPHAGQARCAAGRIRASPVRQSRSREMVMRNGYREQHTNGGKSERNVDEAIEETFPASDPPSIGGVTRVISKPAHHKHQRKSSRSKQH